MRQIIGSAKIISDLAFTSREDIVFCNIASMQDQEVEYIVKAIEKTTYLSLTFIHCNFSFPQLLKLTRALYNNKTLIDFGLHNSSPLCKIVAKGKSLGDYFEFGDFKPVMKCHRIALRKEWVVELANEWINYKEKNVPLTSLFMCFEKYSRAISFVLGREFHKPLLVSSFNTDYKALKASMTFFEAYGITKKSVYIISMPATLYIGEYLMHRDIKRHRTESFMDQFAETYGAIPLCPWNPYLV